MRARGLILAALLPLALLTACGDDSGSATATDPAGSSSPASSTPSDTASASPSESATPSPKPKKPQCADVWQEGKKLPWQYEECYEGEKRVKADGRYCEIGKPLITYRDNWYATPGGPINKTDGPLEDDPDYQSAIKACGG